MVEMGKILGTVLHIFSPYLSKSLGKLLVGAILLWRKGSCIIPLYRLHAVAGSASVDDLGQSFPFYKVAIGLFTPFP